MTKSSELKNVLQVLVDSDPRKKENYLKVPHDRLDLFMAALGSWAEAMKTVRDLITEAERREGISERFTT